MAIVDIRYFNLVNNILNTGFEYEDPNRKGVIRRQIPFYTFQYDFYVPDIGNVFPVLTTKKIAWKSIVGEFIWILKGSNNIKFLIDNGINIWNKDAYNFYLKNINNKEKSLNFNDFIDFIKNNTESNIYSYSSTLNINPYNYYILGDTGKSYGYQLRQFNGYFDQLEWLLKTLKNKPFATKKTITYINPSDKEEQALTPCHTGFKILTQLTENGKIGFYLQWEQDSVDVFLGLPFNIIFYALLAKLIEAITGYRALGIRGDLTNVHIYNEHMEAIHTQLSRNPRLYKDASLNPIVVGGDVDMIEVILNSINFNTFTLKEYNSYPSIKAKMLPYDTE